MSDADKTTDKTEKTAEAPAWTPPEGHTTLLPEAIRDTAASPLVWDENLPADGIVEHTAPSEVVFSMVDETGKGDPLHQDAGAVLTAGPVEVPEQADGSAPPAKKAAAKKAPAKKATSSK